MSRSSDHELALRNLTHSDYGSPEKRVAAWNEFRQQAPGFVPALFGQDFGNASLPCIDLSGAFLSESKFNGANLTCADLTGAILHSADFTSAMLLNTRLSDAILDDARLSHAVLTDADLSSSRLVFTEFRGALLFRANLSSADLSNARLDGTYVERADFCGATFAGTIFARTDLSKCVDLATANHRGPSAITTSTLSLSRGRLPDVFLRGCGLTPWEVLAARLHDPELAPNDFAEVQQKVYDERMKGYFLSGIFISYSRIDEAFVDVLYKRLKAAGANVWLDSQHAVAGSLEKQVQRAIRLNDIVVLVLSEASVQSDWVEAELEWARTKEKDTGREVLCPIALDDSWKEKAKGSVLWRKVKDKNVLDFSEWQAGGFDSPFQKLIRGMKVNY